MENITTLFLLLTKLIGPTKITGIRFKLRKNTPIKKLYTEE
jgi:hypothetical protein